MEEATNLRFKVVFYSQGGKHENCKLVNHIREAEETYKDFISTHPDLPKPTIWISEGKSWTRLAGY